MTHCHGSGGASLPVTSAFTVSRFPVCMRNGRLESYLVIYPPQFSLLTHINTSSVLFKCIFGNSFGIVSMSPTDK